MFFTNICQVDTILGQFWFDIEEKYQTDTLLQDLLRKMTL